MTPREHDDLRPEPVRGLPENLPEGEEILWQGAPDWWLLAKEALSLYWVAGYFLFLFAWRTISGAAVETWADSANAASFFLALGGIVCALLILIAILQARSTVYTLTSRRVAMRIGAALTMTLNLPFRRIANATLAVRPDGSGTIALELMPDGMQFSYAMAWPHVRPWRMHRTRPALRCIPEAAKVAALLAEAAETAVNEPVVSALRPSDAVAAK
ncbi:MAG: PH domain-containing protein [Rhodobacteraceae bacterium]|nr:PH domain-containing protein [Paracoccaceae bacterium]